MIKNLALLLVGTAIGAIAVFVLSLKPAKAPPSQDAQNLEQAFTHFTETIEAAGEFVQTHQWYGSDQEKAEAYRHIIRMMMNILPQEILIDPDFPYFYQITPFSKGGMDNADQHYLVTLIDGEGTYRLTGSRGTAESLNITLYERHALSKSLATLSSDDISFEEDGTFSVTIGGPPRNGNWLPMEDGIKRVLIRQLFSTWGAEKPGALHIDRIDKARPAFPRLTPAIMTQRLDQAARTLGENIRLWPEYSRTRFEALVPKNRLTSPRNVGATGGLKGRVMIGAHFNLTSDEALLIKALPTKANYQGIQLGHHWWASLDYANRQSSLTLKQAARSSDGFIYFILSAQDPGYTNWLDTEGFKRGILFMRYDGLPGATLPKDAIPTAMRIKISELKTHLPEDEKIIFPEERAAAIARRRQHVQQRFSF